MVFKSRFIQDIILSASSASNQDISGCFESSEWAQSEN